MIAIIGDFEPGTDEGVFFENFKTNFVLDVIPKEYRAQVRIFQNEKEALEQSQNMDGTDLQAEKFCAMIYFRDLDFDANPRVYD